MGEPELSAYGASAVANGLTSGLPPEWQGRGAPELKRIFEGLALLGLGAREFHSAALISSYANKPSWKLMLLMLCERIAAAEGGTLLDLEPANLRAFGALLGLSEYECENWMEALPELFERESDLFARASHVEMPKQLNAAFAATVSSSAQLAPLVLDPFAKALYRRSFWVAETRIVTALTHLLLQPWTVPAGLEAAWLEMERHPHLGVSPLSGAGTALTSPFRFAAKQEIAIRVAASAPLTIVTGGPGTGKTSTVIGILRLLVRIGTDPARIFLAAPTGRAANRMLESIRTGLESLADHEKDAALSDNLPEAKTIHRLLEAFGTGDRFRRGADHPLECDYLILDECSMLSLSLFERVLAALPPNARLVLLGDADQLPSVDAGAVFRDLIRAAGRERDKVADELGEKDPQAPLDSFNRPGLDRHCVRLEVAFRQRGGAKSSQILALAERINAGLGIGQIAGAEGMPTAFSCPEDRGHEIELGGECWLRSIREPQFISNQVAILSPSVLSREELAAALIERCWRELRELSERIFQPDELAGAGFDRYFQAFQSLRVLTLTRQGPFGADGLNLTFRRQFTRESGAFPPGTPWMVVRNDYGAKLFNGDIGLSVAFREASQVRTFLVFAGTEGYRRLLVEQVPGLVPAFAMTVHKAQGSEAENVLLVLPEREHPLCTRELIYTALTRAKSAVLIYGDGQLLDQAARQSLTRATRLGQRLHAALAFQGQAEA